MLSSLSALTALQTSAVHVLVFDARKYVRDDDNAGFLGTAIIPATTLLESSSLGDGGRFLRYIPVPCSSDPDLRPATSVLPFRLKKRDSSDVVTGNIVLRVCSLGTARSTPINIKPSP